MNWIDSWAYSIRESEVKTTTLPKTGTQKVKPVNERWRIERYHPKNELFPDKKA